jgi:hypothetical protein
MSYRMMNALLRPDLSASERLVYAYIVGRANGSRVCWPSVAEIMADLGQSKRTVLNATKRLSAVLGLIRTEKRYKDSAHYFVEATDLDEKPQYATRAQNVRNPEEASPVQKTPPKEPNSPVQNLLPETVCGAENDPLRCNFSDSPVQNLLPESVHKEVLKKASSSLRSLGERDKRDEIAISGHRAIVDAWNATAARTHLPLVSKLSPDRARKLTARLAEHSVDEIIAGIERIGASAFCHGAGETGWRADFDFLLQPKSCRRAISGFYDDRDKPNRPAAKSGHQQRAEMLGGSFLFGPSPVADDQPPPDQRRLEGAFR